MRSNFSSSWESILSQSKILRKGQRPVQLHVHLHLPTLAVVLILALGGLVDKLRK